MNATSASDLPPRPFTVPVSAAPSFAMRTFTASTVPASLPATPSTVSTQWLCDHLGSDTMVVLDASLTNEPYRRSHIPTARRADLVADFSDPDGDEPFARPSADRFAEALERLGIGSETTVIVYDTASGQEATRLWWLFRSFGSERVSVLGGGFTKWTLEERPVE